MTEAQGKYEVTAGEQLGVLAQFEPMFSLSDQDGSTVINFDSNFRYDLDREAKAEVLDINLKEKGNSVSLKVENVAIAEVDPSGMQFVTADVMLKLKKAQNGVNSDRAQVLHKLALALPALSRDASGNFTHLSLIDIRMALADKIADAASFALESYFGKIQPAGQAASAFQSRAAHLNVWAEGQAATTQEPAAATAKPETAAAATVAPATTIWGLFKTWPVWKKAVTGVFALFMGWLVLVYASGFVRPVSSLGGADTIAQLQTSPEAHNAQVELTRQTLKEMGLDPANVQSDLGCLAH
ncbi:hypothetical protein L1281_001770 [Neisseria sp. HSC-16F19]|nr:hypothetical protein [Neisseria sp. HSC-16F19]MCP2041176.1 hypothetical protein [Neisseria sp. HSC-16F19]